MLYVDWDGMVWDWDGMVIITGHRSYRVFFYCLTLKMTKYQPPAGNIKTVPPLKTAIKEPELFHPNMTKKENKLKYSICSFPKGSPFLKCVDSIWALHERGGGV